MDPCLFPQTLLSLLNTPQPPVVVDVRRRPAFEADPATLPNAMWRDPRAVEQWAAKPPPDGSLLVHCAHGHCAHGHEVSRGVHDALGRRGVTAGIVEDGTEEWCAAGGPVVGAQQGDGP